MPDGMFRLIVRQSIKPGKLEEVKRLAQEYTSATEANEPDTLTYEWFFDESGTTCYLNELYTSSDAFLIHARGLGPKLAAMLEISPLEEMVVLGEPSEKARNMLAGMGAKFFAPDVGFSR